MTLQNSKNIWPYLQPLVVHFVRDLVINSAFCIHRLAWALSKTEMGNQSNIDNSVLQGSIIPLLHYVVVFSSSSGFHIRSRLIQCLCLREVEVIIKKHSNMTTIKAKILFHISQVLWVATDYWLAPSHVECFNVVIKISNTLIRFLRKSKGTNFMVYFLLGVI